MVQVLADDFTYETSGRSFNAHCGIIGIAADLGVSEGYDGVLGDPVYFSADERAELADYMIARWQAFKDWA